MCFVIEMNAEKTTTFRSGSYWPAWGMWAKMLHSPLSQREAAKCIKLNSNNVWESIEMKLLLAQTFLRPWIFFACALCQCVHAEIRWVTVVRAFWLFPLWIKTADVEWAGRNIVWFMCYASLTPWSTYRRTYSTNRDENFICHVSASGIFQK